MHCFRHVIICCKSGGSYYMTTNDLVKFFSSNNTTVGIVPQHVGLLKFRPFKLVSQMCFWDTGHQEVSCNWNPLWIKVAQYNRQRQISTRQCVASCGCSTVSSVPSHILVKSAHLSHPSCIQAPLRLSCPNMATSSDTRTGQQDYMNAKKLSGYFSTANRYAGHSNTRKTDGTSHH